MPGFLVWRWVFGLVSGCFACPWTFLRSVGAGRLASAHRDVTPAPHLNVRQHVFLRIYSRLTLYRVDFEVFRTFAAVVLAVYVFFFLPPKFEKRCRHVLVQLPVRLVELAPWEFANFSQLFANLLKKALVKPTRCRHRWENISCDVTVIF